MSAALAVRLDPFEWLAAARQALAYVAETALHAPDCEVDPVSLPTGSGVGAFVAVMAQGAAVQIGLVARPAPAAALARRLLDLGPDDVLAEAEVADAIGELANMIAGATKAMLAPMIGVVALGLPMIVHGRVATTDHQRIRGARARIAGLEVELLVIEARS